MNLKDFVGEYVHCNAVVRLVYREGGGHKVVADNWSAVSMAWEIVKGEGVFKDYCDRRVLWITDIFSPQYPEAINVVIEDLPTHPTSEISD